MNKWFNLDSPIMQGLSRLTDLVFLSVLWFACCLPVVTIGASTTAMYYVAMKMVREDTEKKLTVMFFEAFKSNFKQATVMNIIFLAVGAVLATDCFIMLSTTGDAVTLSFAVFLVMLIWMLCIMFYAYPLQAQFYNTIKRTLLNAAILSMRKFPVTAVVFALNMLPVLLAFVPTYGLTLVIRMAPVWVLLMPGLAAYLNSKFFVKMFDPYLKREDEESSEETE